MGRIKMEKMYRHTVINPAGDKVEDRVKTLSEIGIYFDKFIIDLEIDEEFSLSDENSLLIWKRITKEEFDLEYISNLTDDISILKKRRRAITKEDNEIICKDITNTKKQQALLEIIKKTIEQFKRIN